MASISNYATLLQAIKDVAEDDGQEFVDYIPTAIDLAEEKLFRELDLPDLEDKAFGTLTPSSAALLKPTGYEYCEYLTIDVNGLKRNLKKKLESFVNDYWPDTTATGIPKYYTDANYIAFKIVPTPEVNYAYELKYTKKPTKINATNVPTNYYTENCTDLLFSACMIEMCKFMKAWSQVPIWEQTYVAQRESWNVQMMRMRRDGNHVPLAPAASGPNSIKQTIATKA